jgi:hypothetical protein
MNQPLVEPRDNTAADRFTAMADRITQNAAQPFGGAVVIVPPGGGTAIELLMLDPQADIAMFWSAITTKIGIIMEGLQQEKRRQQGFGGR